MLRAFPLALVGCQVVFPIEEPPIDPKCRTKATAIFDDFADGDLAPLWDTGTDGTNTVVEADGRVVLSVSTQRSLARVTAIPFVDLLDSSVSFDIDYDDLVDDAYVSLELLTPESEVGGNGPRVELRVYRDHTGVEMLDVAHQIDTDRLVIRSVPYDKATMGHWKIAREGASTVWFAGPADGPLERLADFALPDLRFVRPQVVVREDLQSFSAYASNFNTDSSHPKVCGADTLVDDFDTGIDRVQWGIHLDEGCEFRGEAGGAVLVDNANSGNQCQLGATGLYDLFRHPITVEVDATLGTERVELDATNLTGTIASFIIERGEFRAETDDNVHMSAGYDPALHRYWRFEGFDDGGGPQLRWSVSGDGKMFSEFARSPQLTDLGRIRFTFAAFNFDTTAPPTLRFDNVNVPP